MDTTSTATSPAAITIEQLDRIRTFGGWYEHDRVLADGVEIGRIQTRRRNKRTSTITLLDAGGCVLGHDLPWLVRAAGLVADLSVAPAITRRRAR